MIEDAPLINGYDAERQIIYGKFLRLYIGNLLKNKGIFPY
jgi:hypothetical protein